MPCARSERGRTATRPARGCACRAHPREEPLSPRCRRRRADVATRAGLGEPRHKRNPSCPNITGGNCDLGGRALVGACGGCRALNSDDCSNRHRFERRHSGTTLSGPPAIQPVGVFDQGMVGTPIGGRWQPSLECEPSVVGLFIDGYFIHHASNNGGYNVGLSLLILEWEFIGGEISENKQCCVPDCDLILREDNPDDIKIRAPLPLPLLANCFFFFLHRIQQVRSDADVDPYILSWRFPRCF